MSKDTQIKLPRGLWVGKIRKPQAQWQDACSPEYYELWYYRIRKQGLPQQLRACPSYVTSAKQAAEYGKLQFMAAEMEQTEELRAAVAGTRSRLTGVTVGQYLRAWEKVAGRRGIKTMQRAVSSLRLVVAVAKGWAQPGAGTRLDANGGKLIHEVEALRLYDVLTDAVTCEYARRVQGGKMLDLRKDLPHASNRTVNSTLNMARVPFARQSRVEEVAALRLDWERIEGFLRLRMPEQGKDVAEELPTAEEYAAMMEGWKTLREMDMELALCNELLRLLGLRSGEMVMARLSWLHEGRDGRTFLWVKNRPEEKFSCKTGTEGKLPLSPELAARLRARCAVSVVENPFLLLPGLPGHDTLGEERAERRDLVRTRHNAWLKQFISEVKTKQGNHRLRKCCATALYAAEMRRHGDEVKAAKVVRDYLRHANEATSLLHYIAANDELLPTMTDETLQAWEG